MSLKQFGGWATDLQHKPFKIARIKLTAFYILMIAVILTVFSFILYLQLSKNLRDDLEGDGSGQSIHSQVVESALDHIETTIVLVDLGVLVVVSLLAYVLAGKTLKPTEQALEAQKQFSADASHELRTPLSIMKHDVEVGLKNSNLNLGEAKAIMQSNLEEVNHMSIMVEQLLKIARSEDGTNKTATGLVELSEIVKSATEKMKKIAENKNIKLSMDKLELGRVIGNFDALKELTLNLLQNAIDYTPAGGSVSLSVISEGKNMLLIIKDSGIGIEAKDLPHVFKRFYKADNARTFRTNRSGLGLAIVKDIVDKHKGRIHIESNIGQGTVVSVFLPSLLQ